MNWFFFSSNRPEPWVQCHKPATVCASPSAQPRAIKSNLVTGQTPGQAPGPFKGVAAEQETSGNNMKAEPGTLVRCSLLTTGEAVFFWARFSFFQQF